MAIKIPQKEEEDITKKKTTNTKEDASRGLCKDLSSTLRVLLH